MSRAATDGSSVPTKKLVNSPETCVDDSLRGLIALYPQLSLHPAKRVVTSHQEKKTSSVALISGGGSGHEPFAAGYVGRGMLSGAVCGGIFTSPPPSHVLHAIMFLHRYNNGGVLVIIPNYTGDRLNFGMAIEKARNAGVKVESIIVDEDLASGQNSSTGARGMCGLTVLYKICGALASEGISLSKVHEAGKEILKNMATFGVSLRACSIPGQPPLFEIAADQVELGTGVHGEAGVSRAKLGTARQVTGAVLDRLVEHLALKQGSRVVTTVNNMGGTTALEMNVVCGEIAAYFKQKGVILERLYSGFVMTCLDQHGFQINVVRLMEPHGSNWLRLLDATTEAPGWFGSTMSLPSSVDPVLPDEDVIGTLMRIEAKKGPGLGVDSQELFRDCLLKGAEALLAQEDVLNRLDAGCGDGDCGTTLRNLAEAVLTYARTSSLERPTCTFAKLSEIAETDMGGTSGGIYSLGFGAVARAFSEEPSITQESWIRAWISANSAITTYGRAKPGDRTMVDTLVPAARALESTLQRGTLAEALRATATAADEGAKSTAAMQARAGRASYVGAAHLVGEDAGARGAAVWLQAVLGHILKMH